MFELSTFNAAQIIDQLFDFVCMYLLTSLSAKTRFYGFTLGLIGFIPATYLFAEPLTEMKVELVEDIDTAERLIAD